MFHAFLPSDAPICGVSRWIAQTAAGGILAELDDLGENANYASFGSSAANVFGDTPQLEFRFSEIKYSVELPRKGVISMLIYHIALILHRRLLMLQARRARTQGHLARRLGFGEARRVAGYFGIVGRRKKHSS